MAGEQPAANRGFLNEEFRLYHLRDNRALDIEYHYHEFDKIVLFLSGKVSYIIEGKTYHLKPWDVLFIRHGSVHRPNIDQSEMYERIVLWMNKGFLDEHSSVEYDLSTCFSLSEERRHCLSRPNAEVRQRLGRLFESLESAARSSEFGSALLSRSFFLQLMVELNRYVLKEEPEKDADVCEVDAKIDEVLQYINGNLGDDMSVDALSCRFYISRYHFMRRFKDATGYTIHSYVLQKRLGAAAELLSTGSGAAEAASTVGFSDYSSFLRSFKRMFDLTPRQYAERMNGPCP